MPISTPDSFNGFCLLSHLLTSTLNTSREVSMCRSVKLSSFAAGWGRTQAPIVLTSVTCGWGEEWSHTYEQSSFRATCRICLDDDEKGLVGVCVPFNKQSRMTGDRFKDTGDGGRASSEGPIINSVYTSIAAALEWWNKMSPNHFKWCFLLPLATPGYVCCFSNLFLTCFSFSFHPSYPFLLTIAKAVLQNRRFWFLPPHFDKPLK